MNVILLNPIDGLENVLKYLGLGGVFSLTVCAPEFYVSVRACVSLCAVLVMLVF